MSLTTRIVKLEQHLSLSHQKTYPEYVSFTSEEIDLLDCAETSQAQKDQILAQHNILGLDKPIKVYVGINLDEL